MKSSRVLYKKHKKEVFIIPAEMFCPAVAIDVRDLSMSLADYQFILDSTI